MLPYEEEILVSPYNDIEDYMESENQYRIAPKELVCWKCQAKILPGHKYHRVFVPVGHDYIMVAVCVKCER